MTTNYPTGLDTFTNPISTDTLNSVPHATQHANVNDAVLALETKVGADGSVTTTTHTFKLSGVATGDKAASLLGVEVLVNKTLTAPKINVGSDATGDMYFRDQTGAFQRLAAGTAAQILNIDSITGLPTWVANPAASNATNLIKGVVEIATAAEINAGAATGGSGAALAITPDQLVLSSFSPSTFQFGDGSDGNVIIAAGTTNLTRDMYYNNLTIQTGGILATKGFRVFVKGTLTYQGTGIITNNGGNGGNGGTGVQGASVGAGGTAGTAASTGASLPDSLPGLVGGAGAQGATGNAGSNGTAGTAAAKSLGSVGVAGGAGATGGTAGSGTGPGAGGNAGSAGAQTGTVFNKLNSIWGLYYLIDNQPTIVTLTGSSGSGSGGGGGGARSVDGGTAGAGGGGGGSGAPGGIVWISANNIVTVNGNTYVQAKGGNGGNGGSGGASTAFNGGGASGGGGGASGSGGIIILMYRSLTGSGNTDVTPGTAGTGGGGGAANGTGTNGTSGSSGNTGNSGVVFAVVV